MSVLVALGAGCAGAPCHDCTNPTPLASPNDSGSTLFAAEWSVVPDGRTDADELHLDAGTTLLMRFALPSRPVRRALLVLPRSPTATGRAWIDVRVGLSAAASPSTQPGPFGVPTRAPMLVDRAHVHPSSQAVFDITAHARTARELGRETLDLVIRMSLAGSDAHRSLRMSSPRATDPALRPRLEVLVEPAPSPATNPPQTAVKPAHPHRSEDGSANDPDDD